MIRVMQHFKTPAPQCCVHHILAPCARGCVSCWRQAATYPLMNPKNLVMVVVALLPDVPTGALACTVLVLWMSPMLSCLFMLVVSLKCWMQLQPIMHNITKQLVSMCWSANQQA